MAESRESFFSFLSELCNLCVVYEIHMKHIFSIISEEASNAVHLEYSHVHNTQIGRPGATSLYVSCTQSEP